ncbi:hypothetical protein BKA62DRAFT_826886 [Auriculariales sp. MPI-PUGE-AT-0066]|nr:hypothetical protein BKA62DRAFT_826886 [Auriculariales sp. MPI-PUGE-AT-0066]
MCRMPLLSETQRHIASVSRIPPVRIFRRMRAQPMRAHPSHWLPLALRLLILLLAPDQVNAITALQFSSCTADSDALAPGAQITVTDVFGQLTTDNHLALDVLATTPVLFNGFSNETERLATLFTTASVLTFDIWSQPSCFCQSIRPPSPLPQPTNSTPCSNDALTYCPLKAGPFAFSVDIPLDADYALMTIQTRLRILDVSVPALQLACIDVAATPLYPNAVSRYGNANFGLWISVALFLAYLVIIVVARIASAWGRGPVRAGSTFWSRMQRTGFICISALSGERFAVAPALLRYCTPAARDILFHTQWCAALGMVAVQWPDFVYPLLSRTAWSMLLFNATLTSSATHWDPLDSASYTPPSTFVDQVADAQSPLFLDPAVPPALLSYPDSATPGLTTFVAAVGLDPTNAFGTSVGLFLCIVGGTIAASVLIWLLDSAGGALFSRGNDSGGKYQTTSAGYSTSLGLGHKDVSAYNDATLTSPDLVDDAGATTTAAGQSARGGVSRSFLSRWWRRTRWANSSSFHWSVLVGNLTRLLLWFHLPVTIFSCYQFSRPDASATAKSLAALAFALVSVFWPLILAWRIAITSTNKLYEETRTLMQLGATYSMYRPESQLFSMVIFVCNVALGVTIGCGQGSGTAQSIIILVVEVAAALVTSLWLPWAHGAQMGVVSFLCCAARIISAVLLVILAPIVSVGSAAGGWVAYAILVIQLGVYTLFVLMLLFKLLEGIARMAYRVSFEASGGSTGSRYPARGGLLNVLKLGHAMRRSDFKHGRALSPTDDYIAPNSTRSGKKTRFGGAAAGSDATTTLALQSRTDSATPLRPHKASLSSSAAFSMAAQARYDDPEDDDGSIMGAWKHFHSTTAQGLTLLFPVPRLLGYPDLAGLRRGFVRVGGGRANADNPYATTKAPPPSAFIKRSGPPPAIAQAQTATASSSTRPGTGPAVGAATASGAGAAATTPFPTGAPYSLSSAFGGEDDDGEDSDDLADQRPQTGSSSTRPLPPGAMPPPHHARTRSQTAIIEDTSTFLKDHAVAHERSGYTCFHGDDGDHTADGAEAAAPPARRKWFGARSSSNNTSASGSTPGSGTSAQTAPEPGGGGGMTDDETASPGEEHKSKSPWFRRTRKSDTDLPTAGLDQPAHTATEGETGGGRSFVVKRKDKPTTPVAPAAAESSFKVIRPQRNHQHQPSQASDPGVTSSTAEQV